MPVFRKPPGQEREIRRPPIDPYGEERRRVIGERIDFPDENDRFQEEERSFTLDGPGRRELEIIQPLGVPNWKAGSRISATLPRS